MSEKWQCINDHNRTLKWDFKIKNIQQITWSKTSTKDYMAKIDLLERWALWSVLMNCTWKLWISKKWWKPQCWTNVIKCQTYCRTTHFSRKRMTSVARNCYFKIIFEELLTISDKVILLQTWKKIPSPFRLYMYICIAEFWNLPSVKSVQDSQRARLKISLPTHSYELSNQITEQSNAFQTSIVFRNEIRILRILGQIPSLREQAWVVQFCRERCHLQDGQAEDTNCKSIWSSITVGAAWDDRYWITYTVSEFSFGSDSTNIYNFGC